MYRGRISRVRMDAEGSTLSDVERVLDDGFGVITRALEKASEAGALRSDDGPLVFPSESEFVENVVESKVREENGAVYHVGRRVVKYNEPECLAFVTAEIETVDSLLEELRSHPSIGIAITPLRGAEPDDPTWRLTLAGTDTDSPDLTYEKTSLFEAARAAVYRVRESLEGR